jgi:hypothetical protein
VNLSLTLRRPQLDTSTKKRTDEVDAIFEQAKKV